MAAVLACGPGAVLSHRTAAKLHGLLDYNGAKLDITVAGRRGRRRGHITVHGFLPLRTDSNQVFRRPAELEATLKSLISRR